MKTLPAMPETTIKCEDGLIEINQLGGYSSRTVTIPVILMHYFWTLVCKEVEETTAPVACPACVESAEE